MLALVEPAVADKMQDVVVGLAQPLLQMSEGGWLQMLYDHLAAGQVLLQRLVQVGPLTLDVQLGQIIPFRDQDQQVKGRSIDSGLRAGKSM